MPRWLWILSSGSRLYGNRIILRPKALDNFRSAVGKMGIVEKDVAAF
ncbi:hypothetical protein KEJ15_02315 [Candidatus Bathyarchaeota archaeon]|nr:hypothetical protein [Candidatus Bathyarchaeota archaeon]